MSTLCMWLGLPAFFLALVIVNSVKTRRGALEKLGREPDLQCKRLNVIARVLFAAGFALWVLGAFMTIGGK
jgi:hypothetical protein